MTQGTWLSDSNVPPIDLRPDHMEMVRDVLRSYVPGREVRAYGSRAKWSAHDSSDLDLVVMSDSRLDSAVIGSLRGAFEESDLPFRVDVFDWSTLPEDFHTEIERVYSIVVRESTCPGWSEYSIREYASLNYGKALPSRFRNADGEYPVYGSNGIIGYHDEALTEAPTIIVGRKGTAGAVHFSPTPCWPIDTTFYHEEEDTQLALFKSYVLSTLGLDRMNSDTAVPGLNRDAAHSVRIQVPPTNEQRRIATVLGDIDGKIALNRKMRKTLEQMAQALFESWFVDFDPVRAKLEGRWREGESLPGLPARLYDSFPGGLIDSELGPIPNGWRICRLDEAADHIRETIDPSRSPDQKYALYSIPAFDSARSPEVAQGDSILSNKCTVYPGTVLMSRLNPDIERVWLIGAKIDEPAIASTEFAVLSPKSPIDPYFLYCSLRSDPYRSALVALVTGTSKSHQRVRPQALAETILLVPSEKISAEFSSIASLWLDQMLALRSISQRLTTLRDTMLPKLISGEVPVPELAGVTDC